MKKLAKEDEKKRLELMTEHNRLQATVAAKEDDFNVQKKMVTQRYLKLQEQAEKYQNEKDAIESKMKMLDTKVEINEAQNHKLNVIIERCNSQLEEAQQKLDMKDKQMRQYTKQTTSAMSRLEDANLHVNRLNERIDSLEEGNKNMLHIAIDKMLTTKPVEASVRAQAKWDELGPLSVKKFRKLCPMWAQIDLNEAESEYKTWKEGDIIWRGQAQKGNWMTSTGHGIVRAIEPGQYIVET